MAKAKVKDDVVQTTFDLAELNKMCLMRLEEINAPDRALDVMVAYLANITINKGACHVRDMVHHLGRSGKTSAFDFPTGIEKVAELSLLSSSELSLIPSFCGMIDDAKQLPAAMGAEWNCGETGKIGHAVVTMGRKQFLGRSFCGAAALLMATLKASKGD